MAAGDRKDSGSFFKDCKSQKGREDVRGKERRGGGEEGKEGRRWRSTGHVGRRVFHKNCWNCWKVPEEFSSSHHKKCKKSLRNSRWAIAANFFLPTSLWPQVCCAGVQEGERCCWELEAVGGQKACSWRRREHDIVLCCGSDKEEKTAKEHSGCFLTQPPPFKLLGCPVIRWRRLTPADQHNGKVLLRTRSCGRTKSLFLKKARTWHCSTRRLRFCQAGFLSLQNITSSEQ